MSQAAREADPGPRTTRDPVIDAPPFFVVGAARSGTTLTRLMLDSHSRLAVPRESHFIVRLAYRRLRLMHRPDVALEHILDHPRFIAWGLDRETVRAFVERARPATYPDVVRAVFGAYAADQGKQRWGDKTPGYVHWIPTLHKLFPDAKFIHVIRDGREVAVSAAERDWWPGSPVSAAFWWRKYVRAGRRGAARIGRDRCHEVRLDRLIANPETELRNVCEFLGERYDAAMLTYPARARRQLGRGPQDNLPPELSHTEEPPTEGLRDWRAGLRPTMAAAVEAACYPVLRDLGFDVQKPRFTTRVYARARWLSDMPPRIKLFVREQMRPEVADV
jgi:hypothetical protein